MSQIGTIEQDDVAFARALAEGDAGAILTFEGRYRPVVRHALSCAVRRWQPEAPVEPEDQVQDFVGFLFMDGGRRLRTFEGRASFGAWVYTVALRYFQRQLARRAPDRRAEDVLARLPDRNDRDPEFAAARAQEAQRIRAAVHELPPSDQLYVRLFFVEGLNASEVARALGKGASAVRMQKMRILERLRQALHEPDTGDRPGQSPARRRGRVHET